MSVDINVGDIFEDIVDYRIDRALLNPPRNRDIDIVLELTLQDDESALKVLQLSHKNQSIAVYKSRMYLKSKDYKHHRIKPHVA